MEDKVKVLPLRLSLRFFLINTLTVLISSKNHVDILATIRIGDILVGIESQGDPNSRMVDSLTQLREKGCDIIICACRTSGATLDRVKSLHTEYGYDLIFVSNPRTDNGKLYSLCNELYVETVMQNVKVMENLNLRQR